MNDELAERIEGRFDCCDITQLIEFLTESGLMKPKEITYYLIKDDYYKRIGEGEAFTDVKYDLAAEYDVSFATVKNIIYSYKHIKP